MLEWLRTRSLAVVVFPAFALSLVGCGDEAESDSEDLTQSGVAFEVLDVARDDAPAGLTVLRKTADYLKFFGGDPPAGVSFTKHWVVHYAMGPKPNDGFLTAITGIEKVGPKDERTLLVHTVDTSPGKTCAIVAMTTDPQVTVRINKQPKTPTADVQTTNDVDSCESGGPILEYSFGNQILKSFLEIDRDGGLDHDEQSCCPPKVNDVAENALPASKLGDLQEAIEAASDATIVTKSGTLTAEGSMSGSLVVRTLAGEEVVIRRVTRSATPGGHDTLEINQAPEAKLIFDLVMGIVDKDMKP